MKYKLFLLFALLALMVMSYSIYKKEAVLAGGKTFYLELRPVDPRSLLQGDYMILNYAVSPGFDGGCLQLDQRGVGLGPAEEDKGFGKSCPADIDSVYLKKLPVASYFFQEGHAKFYDNARYAVFKYDGKSGAVLKALADANLREIDPHAPVPSQN